MNFKVGDKIIAIKAIDGVSNVIGKTGTIKRIRANEIAIDFDEYFAKEWHCGCGCVHGRITYHENTIELIHREDIKLAFYLSLLT